MMRIDASEWRSHFAALQAEGLGWFDFLTAIDRVSHVDVIARVTDSSMRQSALIVAAAEHELASLTPLYPGAGWYERETQEMFGLRFEGLVDQRPLLHRLFVDPPPLLKQVQG